MSWEVEYTDEFEEWWHSLSEKEQVSVDASVRLLELLGPSLKFPHSSGVKGSRHGHLRELGIQFGGRPLKTEVGGRRSEDGKTGGRDREAGIGSQGSGIGYRRSEGKTGVGCRGSDIGYLEYRRTGIGGDKTGNDRWYEEYVPIADDLYDEYIDELRKEGLLDGQEIF